MPPPPPSVSDQLRVVADHAADRIREALPGRSQARLATIRLQAQQRWAVAWILRGLTRRGPQPRPAALDPR